MSSEQVVRPPRIHDAAGAPVRFLSPTVDLNSDLGEGFGVWPLGDDEALLGIVSSANVACGFHAGDPDILRRVCGQAAERGVVIGAQVGYHDLAGFGRRAIDVEPRTLTNDVIYQIGALDGFARVAGTRVRCVKPHGALHNTVVHDPVQAAAVVEAILLYDASLPVMGLTARVSGVGDRDRTGRSCDQDAATTIEPVADSARANPSRPVLKAPVILLADHPVTGGYPVAAVVKGADVDLLAQAVPGQSVRITLETSGRPRQWLRAGTA